MSAKRPGIKGKSRKRRDAAHARHEQLTRERVDWNVSAFTGPLKHRATNEPLLCQLCNVERATWLHTRKDGKPAYLCFGCGGH